MEYELEISDETLEDIEENGLTMIPEEQVGMGGP